MPTTTPLFQLLSSNVGQPAVLPLADVSVWCGGSGFTFRFRVERLGGRTVSAASLTVRDPDGNTLLVLTGTVVDDGTGTDESSLRFGPLSRTQQMALLGVNALTVDLTMSDGAIEPGVVGSVTGRATANMPAPIGLVTLVKAPGIATVSGTDTFTVKVWDRNGVAAGAGVPVNFGTGDPAVATLSASVVLTDSSSQATVTVTRQALGAVNLTAIVPPATYAGSLASTGGGGGGGTLVATSITSNVASLSQTVGAGTGTVVFTLRDQNGDPFAGTIGVISTDTSKATVSPSSGASPLTVTVTPVAAGSATVRATSSGLTKDVVDTVAASGGPVLNAQFAGGAGALGAADSGQALLSTTGSLWTLDGAGSAQLNDTTVSGLHTAGYIVDGTGLGTGRYAEWSLSHVGPGAAGGVRLAIGLSDALNYIQMRGNDMKWYTVLAGVEGGVSTAWKTNADGSGADIADVVIAESDVVRITNTAGVLALAVNGVTKGYTTVAALTAAMGGAGFGHGVGFSAKNFEASVFNGGTPFVRYGYLKVV